MRIYYILTFISCARNLVVSCEYHENRSYHMSQTQLDGSQLALPETFYGGIERKTRERQIKVFHFFARKQWRHFRPGWHQDTNPSDATARKAANTSICRPNTGAIHCVWVGDACTILLLIPNFALATTLWKQARSN